MMLRDEMRDEHHHHHHHKQQQQQQAVNVKRLGRPIQRQTLAGQQIARKYQRAAVRQAEYRRLKAIVPSVAEKKSVSKVLCSELASICT